jgi:hypothetical protein
MNVWAVVLGFTAFVSVWCAVGNEFYAPKYLFFLTVCRFRYIVF